MAGQEDGAIQVVGEKGRHADLLPVDSLGKMRLLCL